MPPLMGKDFRAKTGSTIIASLNQFGRDVDRGVDEFPVFDQETPYSIAGKRGATFSLGGLFHPTDPGQAAVIAAEAANVPIDIKALFDGTNGFAQLCTISTVGFSTTPEGFQEITWDCTGTADATIVGSGPIL